MAERLFGGSCGDDVAVVAVVFEGNLDSEDGFVESLTFRNDVDLNGVSVKILVVAVALAGREGCKEAREGPIMAVLYLLLLPLTVFERRGSDPGRGCFADDVCCC